MVYHLGDGRWWDAEAGRWRDSWGGRIRIGLGIDILGRARRTHVVLAAAHRDHDTSNNADANLVAFCQGCHMMHDPPSIRGGAGARCSNARQSATCSAVLTFEAWMHGQSDASVSGKASSTSSSGHPRS